MKLPNTIQSDRHDIQLQLLNEHHFEAFYAVYGDPVLMQHIKRPLTKEKATRLFNQTWQSYQSSKLPEKITYMIYRDHQHLGLIGLTLSESDQKTAEIGVMILPQWHRKRIGHQAKQMMLHSCFLDWAFDVVYAHCEVGNEAANAANKKLGFVHLHDHHDPSKKVWIRTWEYKKSHYLQ